MKTLLVGWDNGRIKCPILFQVQRPATHQQQNMLHIFNKEHFLKTWLIATEIAATLHFLEAPSTYTSIRMFFEAEPWQTPDFLFLFSGLEIRSHGSKTYRQFIPTVQHKINQQKEYSRDKRATASERAETSRLFSAFNSLIMASCSTILAFNFFTNAAKTGSLVVEVDIVAVSRST